MNDESARAAVTAGAMQLAGDALAVERGGRVIFKDVSFRARSGEIIWLAGRNGAGKTSLLKVIAQLIAPISGTVTLSGRSPELTIAQQVHFIGHEQAVKPALTALENLHFWTQFLGGGDAAAALEAAGLGALAHLPAGVLSSGQRKRLSLARVLAVHRPIWLLDEAKVGLDKASARQLAAQMDSHVAHGGIIIAASHDELASHTQRIDLGGER